MADPLISPFEALYDEYFKIADKIVSSSITNLIDALTPVITAGIILYIMITGYMVIAGRIQDPISDILIKLTKWSIVAFIALNASTITTYLIGGFEGIEKTILQGFSANSGNVFQTLDKTLQNGLMAAAEAQGANTGMEIMGVSTDIPDPVSFLKGLIVAIAIVGAVIIQTFAAGTIIMLAKVSLLVVFALAPLMLAGLFFPQTAKFADGWFNQALNYTLTGVIAAFFASIGASLFEVTVTAAKEVIVEGNFPVVELGVMLLISCFNYFALKQSPSIAAGLAGGVASGTASLMGAARTLAGVGTGIGLASGAARTFAHRSWSATKTGGNAALYTLAAARHPVQATKTAGQAAYNAANNAVSNANNRVSNAWKRANDRVTGGGNSVNKN